MLFFLFPVLMIAAALQDLFSMKISDWISAMLCIAFFGLFFTTSFDDSQLLSHMIPAALALLTLGTAFLTGSVGGGDAKLAAATILWVGQGPALIDYLVVTALAGGAFAMIWAMLHKLAPSAMKSGAG